MTRIVLPSHSWESGAERRPWGAVELTLQDPDDDGLTVGVLGGTGLNAVAT